ncbi:MAG TPA: hypothetical protein VNT32_08675 [Thermoleophilaceae bacterium]|nr:hypothetical protein [Thermoleophilaceae bacterium]
MPTEVIYVGLLNEGVDVWAPVEAEALGDGVFALPQDPPADQEWAFPPGSRVRCEPQADGLVAVALAV